MSIKKAGTEAITYLVTLIKQQISNSVADKVDKVDGKGLSTNDYTTAEKNKLSGIAEGANKTTINNTLTSTSTTDALSAAQGKALKDQIDTVENSMSNLGYGDMLKSTYDTDGDGTVDDSAKLGGQLPSYYAAAASIPTKLSALTNDSGYQTSSQVTSIVEGKGYQTSAQVQSAINTAISSVYKPQGSVKFASLPTPASSNLGYVYNVSDAFTTSSTFLEGSGLSYPAGTNVVVVQSGTSYLWDVLAGAIDLTPYAKTDDIVELTNDEILTIWNSTTG
jgi:hypothetical protein